jgi:hypothetical protein
MIDRDQLMEFIRYEEFEDTLFTLSDVDKIEIMIACSQAMNDEIEQLIRQAIDTWEEGGI